jgi:hypothetical protein
VLALALYWLDNAAAIAAFEEEHADRAGPRPILAQVNGLAEQLDCPPIQ